MRYLSLIFKNGIRNKVSLTVTMPSVKEIMTNNSSVVFIKTPGIQRTSADALLPSLTGQGVRIEERSIGGEDVIINPPAELKNGDRVERKK